jgi:tripartite-type tricarboxylate transporter receptor subunit TctC
MKLPRRKFLHLTAGVAALSLASRHSSAQTYPTQPVRWIVGFAPGGPNDTFARLIGQWLSERLGQPFVIENRPGAASNIAAEAVVKAAPDGYTLLSYGTAAAVNATLYDRLNFDVLRDIAPVAGIVQAPSIMLVIPSLSANTVPEFIAYAKANPGRIGMGSPGTGTIPHLAGELFKTMTGVEMVHVPYRGDPPVIADLLAGRVQVSFPAPVAAIEHIKAGKLRALAVTTATRWEGLPDIPTLSEFVPGYEVFSLFGVGAPRNTRAEIIGRLNTEINAGLADPKIKARLADLGGTVLAGSPADFGRLVTTETEKWRKVIRTANIKPQ